MGTEKSPDQLRISRPRNCPDVEVWRVQGDRSGIKFFHDTYTVCSLISVGMDGWAEWLYRKKKYFSPARNMMLMEPGEVHVTEKVTAPGSYFVARISKDLMARMGLESGILSNPHLRTPNVDSPEGWGRFIRFHRALEKNASQLEIDSRLAGCVQFLFQNCMEESLPDSEDSSAARCLFLIREYIQEYASSDISLNKLVDMSGLSRFRLLRSFKEKFGLPPHAYQLHIRITQSMNLLKKDDSFSGINVGFSDQSHFIRHFKRIVGVTPGQYAAMVKKPFSGAMA